MPQFSPLWFINIISWSFNLISLLIYINQAIIFPKLIKLQLSRKLLTTTGKYN
jgi:hypothetical protein